ncbi:MAG: LysR substrate-binding domain-containing protein, partial [Burkholderia gladioli]
PLMSVSDTEAIKRLLLAQQSLAYLSRLSVSDELARGDLQLVEIDAPRIERALHMVWLKGRSLSPGAQALMELMPPDAAVDLAAPASASATPRKAAKGRRKPA